MPTLNEKQTLLQKTLGWLTSDEASLVASTLDEGVADDIPAGEQMAAMASILESFGIRVTAPLLMGLVGKGSKGSAVETVREFSRTKFKEKIKDKCATVDGVRETPVSSQPKIPESTPAPTAPGNVEIDIDSLADQVANLLGAQLGGQFASLAKQLQLQSSELQKLTGELGWLKAGLDTERQLRRHVEKHGPLTEPAAPVYSASDRRMIISNLGASLQSSKFQGESHPGSSGISGSGKPMFDEADTRE